MLVTTREMFEQAREGGYALPAPDFVDSNSCRAYVRTAEKLKQPLILSWAEAHKDMLSIEEAALIGLYYAKTAKVPVALHLDHGQSLETVKKAIRLGFTSVMIDASMEDFDENVRRTREVVEYAHQFGVMVEAEIGHVGTGETYDTDEFDTVYTEVEEAVRFVELTGVDSLAVSIGTAHGQYHGTPIINFDRLHELRAALPVPLVLHGGSGSGEENLERCALEGITKINIFTDFMLAARASVEENNPKSWQSLLKGGDAAMAETLEYYFRLFHAAE
jgi:ketose-bisphosphate aldolase